MTLSSLLHSYARATAAAALIAAAGCAGSLPALPPSVSTTTSSIGVAVPSCHVSAKLKPGGGFITLPKCFGFSGRIAYPYSSTNGTITADLKVSTKNPGVYEFAKGTVYYMTWVFTSTSSADTTIGFYHTYVSPHNGCRIAGPFNPAVTYYGDFEVPNTVHPIKQTKIGIIVAGDTQGHAVVGIPFVGTPVLAGVKNYVLISTSQN